MSTGTAVARRDAVTDVCVAINNDDYKAKIRSALPATVDTDRFVRVATTAIQINPDVVTKGTKGSVLTALIRCAQDGLLPDGREAALTLFGNQCAYLPMIGGFRKKAAEHGFSLTAQVVHACDEFDYTLGLEPTLAHKPPKLDMERGDPIGAYGVAAHPTYGVFVEVMSRQEIEHVRKSSRSSGSSGPWAQHWGEMARKTVARRLFKQLPLGATDERVAGMLRADDAEHDFSPGPLDDLPAVDPAYEPVEGEVHDDDDQGTLT